MWNIWINILGKLACFRRPMGSNGGLTKSFKSHSACVIECWLEGTEVGVEKAMEEIICALTFLNRFGEKMLFIHSTVTHSRV